jgi:hypothetical protein
MAMALLSRRAGAMPQSLSRRAVGVAAPIRARPQARSQSGGSRSSGTPWLDRVFGSKGSVGSGGGGGGGGGGGIRSDIMAFVQLLGVAATLLTITTQVGRGRTGASWRTALSPAGASALVLMRAGGTHANWAPWKPWFRVLNASRARTCAGQLRTELGAKIDAQSASAGQLRTELGAKIDAQSAKIDALTRAINDEAESVGALRGASDI